MRSIFFYILGGLAFWFGFSYGWPSMYVYGEILLCLLVSAIIYNIVVLTRIEPQIEVMVNLPSILTLGDTSIFNVKIKNEGTNDLYVEPVFLLCRMKGKILFDKPLFDEYQKLKKGAELEFELQYTPKTRGEMEILPLVIDYFVFPFLFKRSFRSTTMNSIKIFPSILQMNQFKSLLDSNKRGLGRNLSMKRIQSGFSYELEQIMKFVPGDDYRKINWKVSGKRAEIMVNRYQSEKVKDVFLVLDTSRVMLQKGAGSMKIFEYAVNIVLMLSNIILQKGDRCGLILVGKRNVKSVPLGGGQNQLRRIIEGLYKLVSSDNEANFYNLETMIGKRSLLILCSHLDQKNGVNSLALKRIQSLYSTVSIYLSPANTSNIQAIALNAGLEYLTKRSV